MKTFILSLYLLIPILGFTQEEPAKRYVHTGILCGDISLAPGFLLQENISTVSVPAGIEFYVDPHVSFKADVYFHVSSGMTQDSLKLIANHQLFVGASYHFTTKGYFDPYLSFQPGVSYAQVQNESKIQVDAQTKYGTIDYSANIVPILGVALGFNYYFPRYFHIFVEARYVHGTLLYNAPGSFPLDELKLQFGLGWNLNLIKQKKAA